MWRFVSPRVHHRPGRSIRRHVQQQQLKTELFIPIILVPVSLPSHADYRIRCDARKGQQSTGTVYSIFIDGYRRGRTIPPLWNFLFIFKQFMTINRLTPPPLPSVRNPGSTTDFFVGLRRKSFHFFKKLLTTRMHSSKIRTVRNSTRLLWGGGWRNSFNRKVWFAFQEHFLPATGSHGFLPF